MEAARQKNMLIRNIQVATEKDLILYISRASRKSR